MATETVTVFNAERMAQIEELVLKQSYFAQHYGATGDGVTNDSAAIQAAIDDAHANGGGTVLLPPGIHIALNLILKKYVDIKGSGRGATWLRAPASGTNADAVIRTTEDTDLVQAFADLPHHSRISDITIDGNARAGGLCDGIRIASRDISGDLEPANDTSAQGGPDFTPPWTIEEWNDPYLVIENVFAVDCGRHGFLIGASQRGLRMNKCFAYACRRVGIYILATDYWISDSDTGACADGFVLRPEEARVTGCKAWYSYGNKAIDADYWSTQGSAYVGNGAGFTILGLYGGFYSLAGLTLVGCSSQDNYGYGFSLYRARNIKMSACRSGGDKSGALNIAGDATYPATMNEIELALTWGDRPAGNPPGSLAGTLIGVRLDHSSTVGNNVCLMDDEAYSHATGYVPFAFANGALSSANRLTTGKKPDSNIVKTVPSYAPLVTITPGTNTAYSARVRDGWCFASKIRYYVGTAAGNINIAVYSSTTSGAPGTKKAETGSIACPAAGVRESSLIAPCLIEPGDWICIAVDNAANRIYGVSPFAAASSMYDGISGYFTITGLTMPTTAGALTGYGLAYDFRAVQ